MYSHRASALTLAFMLKLTLGRNTRVSVAPFILSIDIIVNTSIDANVKTKMTSGPLQSVNYDAVVFALAECEYSLKRT